MPQAKSNNAEGSPMANSATCDLDVWDFFGAASYGELAGSVLAQIFEAPTADTPAVSPIAQPRAEQAVDVGKGVWAWFCDDALPQLRVLADAGMPQEQSSRHTASTQQPAGTAHESFNCSPQPVHPQPFLLNEFRGRAANTEVIAVTVAAKVRKAQTEADSAPVGTRARTEQPADGTGEATSMPPATFESQTPSRPTNVETNLECIYEPDNEVSIASDGPLAKRPRLPPPRSGSDAACSTRALSNSRCKSTQAIKFRKFDRSTTGIRFAPSIARGTLPPMQLPSAIGL